MGQAKQRAQSILNSSRDCIFCGGRARATTVDHQPARALFDRRDWPEGYAFPACEPCNRASKDAEHKLALLVRIDTKYSDDPVRRREVQKYLVGMRNNFPGLLKPFSANEKRKFLKSEGIKRPLGAALVDMHVAGIQAEAAEELFDTTMTKLLKALHWKHTGNIVRYDEGVKADWYTNAYFDVFRNSDEEEFYMGLPARPPIVRSGRDLSDQFVYRYGKDAGGELSAYLLIFRRSLIVTGIVAQSDELVQEIRSHKIELEKNSSTTGA
ncbi:MULTISPECIES: hypothetical protein [Bradyrhizobium]|uniref:hypothetical protein n=1 Tax=Bradyrhizobium TaxID=374 RepID=UPI0005523748|nr:MULTISPECIES: hypothetical protein [unclassified Bradyrhizobium]MDA9425667.1 hypothetical protein [Bradyrhizobium sp. CCBAU 53380]